ncbi:rhodanese-like domain-containing protein [Rhodocaloribacter sp.]
MAGYAFPESLVETAWVEAHLNDPDVCLVEVDVDVTSYVRGHLPGAVAWDWSTELSDPVRRDILSKADFERLMSASGIANDTRVILYGDQSNWFAAWALWQMKIYGHERVCLMNGGTRKWIEEGRPLTKDVSPRTPVRYTARDADVSLRALLEEVRAASESGDAVLIDVRTPDEFNGKVLAPLGLPETCQRGGHIPGAHNVPWDEVCREDGTFKGAGELRALFTEKGIPLDRTAIPYCRIGERSAHMWFVLKYLVGVPDVKHYDGSWTEWGNLVGATIARSKFRHAPHPQLKVMAARTASSEVLPANGRTKNYVRRQDILAGWPVEIVSYEIGDHHYCDIYSVSPGNRLGGGVGMSAREARAKARDQAWEQLSDLGRRLSVMLANFQDAFVVVDENWELTYLNEKSLSLLGQSYSESLGLDLWEAFPELAGGLREPLTRALQSNGRADLEIRLPSKERWFNVRTSPAGEGLAIYLIDITQRKNAEMELAVMNRKLEEELVERKRIERDLRKAKREAEEMSRLKSAFLSNMTHEIRTPLAGILGITAILSEEISGEHREFIHLIENSGKRLLDTLNSVLDLSLIESGSVSLDVLPVRVLEVVRDKLVFLEPLARRKGLTLGLGQVRDVEALVDYSALDRILNHLLGNAIKFTSEGCVEVDVYPMEERVHIRVRDTGIGISPEFKAHMFEAFKQESTGTDRSYEGSGLGLAIVKHLVERMDGTISVESTPGKGSAFTISFPRAPEKRPKRETRVRSVFGSNGEIDPAG